MTPPTSEAFDALPGNWAAVLAMASSDDLLGSIAEFVADQRRGGQPVYPAARQEFRAFELTPFDAVGAVIVGLHPYHREGQAHGLAFSLTGRRSQAPIAAQHLHRAPPKLRHPASGDWVARALQLVARAAEPIDWSLPRSEPTSPDAEPASMGQSVRSYTLSSRLALAAADLGQAPTISTGVGD